MFYKSLIFAVFMPRKEKIANTFVSAILNSNGGETGIRTLVTIPSKHDFQSCALDQLSHLSKRKSYFIHRYIICQ